jgi:hypothetical protein
MKTPIKTLLAGLLLAASLPLAAHHSAAQFDFAQNVTVEGTVKHIRVANPHMELTLEVADAKGQRDIAYEGHSANNIYRLGWRKDMVKDGDTVTIVIAPRRDGADGGYVKSVTTSDGHKF